MTTVTMQSSKYNSAWRSFAESSKGLRAGPRRREAKTVGTVGTEQIIETIEIEIEAQRLSILSTRRGSRLGGQIQTPTGGLQHAAQGAPAKRQRRLPGWPVRRGKSSLIFADSGATSCVGSLQRGLCHVKKVSLGCSGI